MVAQSPRIVQVAVDAPVDRLFDYLAEGVGPEDVGRRVRVPFGPRVRTGVLIGLADAGAAIGPKLRPVGEIDRELPALPADILQLARFAAEYYHHPLGPVLLSLLPPALKRQSFRSRPIAGFALTEAGRRYCAGLGTREVARRRLAGLLAQGPVSGEVARAHRALLREWLRQGWVAASETPLPVVVPTSLPDLTADQARVVETLAAQSQGFAVWLLHGVTGSGKTEVYLRRVAACLEAGRQALMLVPEIHLTPQFLDAIGRRFPKRRVVGLHSGLAQGERLEAWRDCLEGRAEIVLGTRLAVFTPLPRLGLIIVDEEHDPSYKQIEGLRYHARDVAVWRGRQRGVPVLLGSATPSLESWLNASRGRYRKLVMSERARSGASLPEVVVVDSRRDRSHRGLSESLRGAVAENLERGEQSLLFINRRGFAPVLYCAGCGHIGECPRCSAHQVVHRLPPGYQLRCHHCGLAARPPQACPRCGSLDLRAAGQGTQRLEGTLAELFPGARILRIDRDSAARKGAFAEMRDAVAARAVDILVGTQIIAKGHDFPHLTLVGVIGADQALMSVDPRATERLFAQLMQVGGRAGRAERPGRVLIQTDYPRHPLYAALIAHDYAGFAEHLLRERRAARFPPFVHQALLRAEAASQAAALAFLDEARRLAVADGVRCYDPVPALVSRVANRERAQLLVQATARSRLQSFLGPWVAALGELPAGGVRWLLDVDPLDV